MSLVIPEWVARNHRVAQEIEQRDTGLAQMRYWNPLLADIDERLSLVKAKDRGMLGLHGVLPGRWHVVRVNESGPDTYWPIIGPDGEFREMGSRDLEDFKGRDLWNPAVRREIDHAQRRRRDAAERARETRREQRVHELTSNVNAMIRPSVLVSDDVRWANRPAGNRGRTE